MSLFKPETIQAEKSFNTINPFAANLYNATVTEANVVEVDETDWSMGHPIKNPDVKVDNVQVVMSIDSTVDGTPVIGMDGKDPTFNTLSFWFNPTATGISKKGPSKARSFLCMIMGWDIKEKINLAVLEDLIVNKKLVGKPVRLTVEVNENGKNKIANFLPAKKV